VTRPAASASAATTTATGDAPEQPRREAILDATLRILRLDGPRALSHRTVAKAAGVPLAATTYYFASKEELMEEALRRIAGEEVARLDAARVALPEGSTPAEMAGLLAAALRAEYERELPKFEIYLEAARRPALRDHCAHWIGAFRALAEAAMRDAGAPDPERGARLLVAAIDGLIVQRLATAEGPYRDEDLRADLERMVRMSLTS
jgi:DNA-binding transcriptional regulator YbjK